MIIIMKRDKVRRILLSVAENIFGAAAFAFFMTTIFVVFTAIGD